VGLRFIRQNQLTGLGVLLGLATVHVKRLTVGSSARYIQLEAVTPHALSRSLHSAQGFLSVLTSTDTMASLIPPQLSPTWTHTADDVTRLTKEVIAQDRSVQDKVAALAPDDCNMASVSSMGLDVKEG
jgi:hypothetical protein